MNGFPQTWVAPASMPTVASVNAAPTNQAAGRHRRERSRPSGKSKNTKASTATGITQIQLDSQANARPPGSDPGAAIRACSPYWFQKLLSPTAKPATRNSQPIRLTGRMYARTKPMIGTTKSTTFPNTSEKSQPVKPVDASWRSAYAKTSPPASSAIDPAARPPATHRLAGGPNWILPAPAPPPQAPVRKT